MRAREVPPRRRRDVDQDLRAVEREELGRREVPEVLADRQAQAHAQLRRNSTDHVARGEEPPLVEHAVGRQVDLAVDVAELAVLQQRRGDEQPVVGGLLHERHHGREPACRSGERCQPGVVETHRDLRRQVLEQVPGEAQLREHDEAGPGVAGLRDELLVAREIGLEVPEAWRDLGEGDPERLHAASIAAARSGPRGGACAPAHDGQFSRC